jgi:replication-associated recombination protein RarA
MTLDQLVLHPRDRYYLDALAKSDIQSVLLVADRGFGKVTIARSLALTITNQKAYACHLIEANSGSITIDQVRDIKSFLATKNSSDFKRAVVITDAERMTLEAQNALLKILEEPPKHTMILLTSATPEALLPTIVSRTQLHRLSVPATDDLQTFMEQHTLSTSAMGIGGGLPGITIGLARGENDELSAAVDLVKAMLSQTVIERLRSVDGLSKDKQSLDMFLYALQLVSTGTMRAAYRSGKSSKKWRSLATLSLQSTSMLRSNASTKLVLTRLMISL